MNKRQLITKLGLVAGAAIVGVQFFATAPSTAATGTSWETVRAAYQVARNHATTEDVDKALDLADGFLVDHPQDGRALTYRGSLSALRARLSWMPWKKLGMLNDGISQMDEGVSLVSKAAAGTAQEIEVRMVRGTTSANIPGAFGRGGVAYSDFKAVVNHPRFGDISIENRAAAMAWLAALSRRQGQEAEGERLQKEAEAIDQAIALKIREQAA